jgi:hypothetical protein
MLALSFSRVVAAQRIPVLLSVQALLSGFRTRASHAHGNDNKERTDVKAPSLYYADPIHSRSSILIHCIGWCYQE